MCQKQSLTRPIYDRYPQRPTAIQLTSECRSTWHVTIVCQCCTCHLTALLYHCVCILSILSPNWESSFWNLKCCVDVYCCCPPKMDGEPLLLNFCRLWKERWCFLLCSYSKGDVFLIDVWRIFIFQEILDLWSHFKVFCKNLNKIKHRL